MQSDSDLRRRLVREGVYPRKGRSPGSDAVSIGGILKKSGFLKRLRHRHAMRGLSDAWIDTAGPDVAGHTEVAGLDRGVLRILVDSAACLHEIANFHKNEMLAGLREHEGCERIHDIEFRLGTLERQ